jgi:hypothetical protein
VDPLLLTHPYRFFGEWHVLDHDDEALAGDLTYEPDGGLRLDVVGHFGGIPSSVAEGDPVKSHPIVLGQTKNRQITLYGCTQVATSITIPGPGSTTYAPNFALFGAHDDGRDPFASTSVKVRIPLLDAWLPMSGLSHEMHLDETSRQFDEFVHRYKAQKPFEIDMPWGAIKVSPAATLGGAPTLVDRETRMSEWFDLTFRFSEPELVTDILADRVAPLVDLVSLLTLVPALPTYFALLESIGPRNSRPAATREIALDVLYHHPRAAEPTPKVDSDRFLVRPDSPGVRPFPELVKTWYGARDAYQRSMDMLFGMERSPRGTYTEVRFLILCHAAEALHRDKPLPQERYTKSEYKSLQRRALAALAGEPAAEAFLKEQLRYANQLTLRERLVALRNAALGEDSEDISDDLIGRTVKARNNLTHSSTADLARLEDTGDLYYLAEYVVWLLRASFLAELGLSQSDVCEVLGDNRRFSWLKRSFPDNAN